MMRSKLAIMVAALGLLLAGPANAVQVNPPPAGFLITGFIQEATLDGSVAGHASQALPNTNLVAGGTITVNGVKILVPNNLIVQMPAAAFTWQQMFNTAISTPVIVPGTATRTNHRAGQTGLALADNPLAGTRAGVAGATGPFPSFEVTVQGNITFDAAGNQPYIAALILPATTLMGATFPIAVRILAQGDRLGKDVGVLYSVNTLGSVAGCMLTAFVLLGWAGMNGTIVKIWQMPPLTLQTFSSIEPAMFALEVKQGIFAQLGFLVADLVILYLVLRFIDRKKPFEIDNKECQ